MTLDDGIVIITTISNLIRALAIGFAVLVIGCAAVGLRFADQDGDDTRPDPVRRDPS